MKEPHAALDSQIADPYPSLRKYELLFCQLTWLMKPVPLKHGAIYIIYEIWWGVLCLPFTPKHCQWTMYLLWTKKLGHWDWTQYSLDRLLWQPEATMADLSPRPHSILCNKVETKTWGSDETFLKHLDFAHDPPMLGYVWCEVASELQQTNAMKILVALNYSRDAKYGNKLS